MGKLLSIIIPAYNEESVIHQTADIISSIMDKEKIDFEMIFVCDGSKDGTWENICTEAIENCRVAGLCFSRNFGKEAAIVAGLSHSSGDCCAVIDCDLQHPPQKLVEMYRLWESGYEVIEGMKIDRGKEKASRAFFVRGFYAIFSRAVHIDMSKASDFKLLDRKAVNAMLCLPERSAFFRALSSWVGFKTASVPFEVQPRLAGNSKWSTWSLTKYAINNIASFSTAPMQIVTILGCIMLLVTIVFGSIALYQKITGMALDGFTTVIFLQLFTGSIVMISLGIIGYYIARIHDEIKRRPRFVISETCGEIANAEKTVG